MYNLFQWLNYISQIGAKSPKKVLQMTKEAVKLNQPLNFFAINERVLSKLSKDTNIIFVW